MRGLVLLTLVAIEVAYLIGGGFIFWALENASIDNQTTETTTVNLTQLVQLVEDGIGDGNCVNKSQLTMILLSALATATENATTHASKWDIGGSIFFAITVVSTIGYGNLYPTKPGSRVFFCFYAVVGIPLTLVILVGIGEKLNGLGDRIEERITKKRPRVGKVAKTLFILFVGGLCFLLVPAAIFAYLQDWSYGMSIYYGIVTLTSIGFGDMVAGFPCPSRDVCGLYRVTIGLWIFFGLAWLSGLISSLQQSFDAIVNRVDSEPIGERKRGKNQQKTVQDEGIVSDSRIEGQFVKLNANDENYEKGDAGTTSGQSTSDAGDVSSGKSASNRSGIQSSSVVKGKAK